MQDNVRRLRAAIEEWLIRNDLETDTFFMTPKEWRARGENYHEDSVLVLCFEGNLHTLLNFGGDSTEFDDYIESFGFWYEMGHSWNMGFYPIEGYDFRRLTGTYAQKLRDPRWKAKADAVKRRAGHKCQDCGATTQLEAHHCYYMPMSEGHEPWEYPLSAFLCLCRDCHEKRAKSESRMRAFLARLATSEIDALRTNLDTAFYWFEQPGVIEFLSQLGHSDEKAMAGLQQLFLRRN